MSMKQKLPFTDTTLTGRRLNPDLRRAQLLEHAISAFADAGIERAAHADVAERANVSTPTVFKYFPSRDVLVDAVLKEVEKTFERLKENLPSQHSSAPEVIRATALALTNLCIKRPDLMKVALTWSVAFSPIRTRYLTLETRLLSIISNALDPKISDKSDKHIIFGTANLYVRMHFDETSALARRDYINRMCEQMKPRAL